MEDENTSLVTSPEKSRLLMLAGAIGLLMFVISVAVFSITMGVFSSSNVVPVAETVEAQKHGAEEAEDEYGGFHPSYYEDLDSEEGTSDSTRSKAMSEKDSLEHVAWYEKQKSEIESERRQIEVERAELDKLKHETMTLIDQRRTIEDANTVQMAKLFDSMNAPEIAAIMENMTDEQVGAILMKMKKQTASKVLAELPAERAAKITTQMMNLAEGS